MNSTGELANQHPRVSVLMGIARMDPFLEDAIRSILDQSFADFEFLIVIDEGSPEIERQIRALFPTESRIRLLRSPSLGGLAFALNLGIGAARGEYIARMDGDDLSYPDRLLEQVRYLDAHPEVGVLGCRVEVIDSQSRKLRRDMPFYETNHEIRRILPLRNPMVHPALMFRRSTLYAVQGYKYANSAEDYEMLIRIARNPAIQFHNLDLLLFAYRRHDEQATALGKVRSNFVEKAGYLFTELLRTHNWRYAVGIVVIHPLIYRMRMLLRRWKAGSDL